MSRRLRSQVVGLLVLGAVGGCAATTRAPSGPSDGGPTIGDLTSRPAAITVTSLYTPTRGPVPFDDVASLVPPDGAPLKAAVYVPSCSTPAGRPDHVAYLQSLGLVVVVPGFGGDGCVVATDRLGSVHAEIDDVVVELRALPWVRQDAVYLVGHGIGADVATTYTRAGTFEGIVALAAACPFGIQNVTPILTFRTLDDAVLSNRGRRCVEFTPANAMHLEFAGNDHIMRLSGADAENEARTLMRNTIARFIGAERAADTLAERDAADLQQLGSLRAADNAPTAASAPERVDDRLERESDGREEMSGASQSPSDVDAGSDAAPAASAATEPAAAEPTPPPVRGFGNGDVIYIPDLDLPPGRY